MRKSGILLHISSLPSSEAIGTLGKNAYDWVDFLSSVGIKLWQILPFGHTGFANSPYQTFSAFAGNPFFIDINSNKNKKYFHIVNNQKVDYLWLDKNKLLLLKEYIQNFEYSIEYDKFCNDNSFWLNTYSLFMSLKTKFDYQPWYKWPNEYKFFNNLKINTIDESEIDFYKKIQFLFYSQWKNLKNYANSKNIEIIGDLPIYISMDSADIWSNHGLFMLDDNLEPTYVAGVPPDYFSEKGQLWGNPLYNWEQHKQTNYKWWSARLRHSLINFDYIRFDHFRGLDSFWAIPSSKPDATEGIWLEGPAYDFLDMLNSNFNSDRFIMEDLGIITNQVKSLRDHYNFKGMKILQFAFNQSDESEYLPHNHIRNSVVYTGTHDNDTLKSWLNSSNTSKSDIAFAMKYLNCENETFVEAMIRAAYSSVSEFSIIPFQDWLELDSDARLNIPGTSEGNWEWRFNKSFLTDELKHKIKSFTTLYYR